MRRASDTFSPICPLLAAWMRRSSMARALSGLTSAILFSRILAWGARRLISICWRSWEACSCFACCSACCSWVMGWPPAPPAPPPCCAMRSFMRFWRMASSSGSMASWLAGSVLGQRVLDSALPSLTSSLQVGVVQTKLVSGA
eukprot:CAMPEP_0182880760 /NCGR_PEP_ID=MMETSP0034_2-20130328/16757_1 /TAXON_ID=156128 /ORGANISM="Nephroselmis pyriformis, Strain CCMP717" /LENGTH=142 /DNA_ID=CAMNT_0025013759 /DNA_START=164 /DNA_END=592 /DNA_ORIENTATION=+